MQVVIIRSFTVSIKLLAVERRPGHVMHFATRVLLMLMAMNFQSDLECASRSWTLDSRLKAGLTSGSEVAVVSVVVVGWW